MINRYETWLIDEIENVLHFPYKDIKFLDEYPLNFNQKCMFRTKFGADRNQS